MDQIPRSHGSKNHRIWPRLGVSGLQFQFECTNCYEMLHKAWISIEVALLFFKVIRQISRSHGSKNHRIWPKLAVSGLQLQFEFTNGYEMMHKAWSSIKEMPYCFWGSYVKFLGHTAKKNRRFWPEGAPLFSKVIHQISRSHGITYHQFRPELSVSEL